MYEEWTCTHCGQEIGHKEKARVDEGMCFHLPCWIAWQNQRAEVFRRYEEECEHASLQAEIVFV